jgi:hypothetical protein
LTMIHNFSSIPYCSSLSFVFLNSWVALSHWCVFHRKRARRIVDTWEKQFNNATKDKKVSLLYLSNDILQNSKRKGGEFVNEFWRVLPGSLKDVYGNGGEHGKKVVARLVSCLLFHHYSLYFELWDIFRVGTRINALMKPIIKEKITMLSVYETS